MSSVRELWERDIETGLQAGASGGANRWTTFDACAGSSGSSFALMRRGDAAPFVGVVVA